MNWSLYADFAQRDQALILCDLGPAQRVRSLQAFQALLAHFPKLTRPPRIALWGPGAHELSHLSQHGIDVYEIFNGNTQKVLLVVQLGLLEPADQATFGQAVQALQVPLLQIADPSLAGRAETTHWWLRYHLLPSLWQAQRGRTTPVG